MALNLNEFFAGLLENHQLAPAARIDRLAAALAAADAENSPRRASCAADPVEPANADYRRVEFAARCALNHSVEGAARQTLGEALGDVIVSAAAKISTEGHARLADWPQPRGGNTARR